MLIVGIIVKLICETSINVIRTPSTRLSCVLILPEERNLNLAA